MISNVLKREIKVEKEVSLKIKKKWKRYKGFERKWQILMIDKAEPTYRYTGEKDI